MSTANHRLYAQQSYLRKKITNFETSAASLEQKYPMRNVGTYFCHLHYTKRTLLYFFSNSLQVHDAVSRSNK